MKIDTAGLINQVEMFGDPDTMVAFDVETTIHNDSPKAGEGAKMVLGGTCRGGPGVYYTLGFVPAVLLELAKAMDEGNMITLVGHNLKFDLAHCHHAHPALCDRVLRHRNFLGIWDTSVVDYLDSAQQHKYPSLSACLKRHGIPHNTKDEIKEEYFDKGLGADHVPRERLEDYLKDDLASTLSLAKAQQAKSDVPKNRKNLIFVQGWAAWAYATMESNGLHMDREKMQDMEIFTEKKVETLDTLVTSVCASALDMPPSVMGHVTNRTLSTVFFGNPGVPVKRKKPDGKYKNGKPKFKTVEERHIPDGKILKAEDIYDDDIKPNDALGWPVNETYLNRIAERNPGTTYEKLARIALELRAEKKKLSTYLRPLLGKMNGANIVHHNINNTVTGTGRTSSSDPNAQNMLGDIRKCVTARHSDNGICQVDFSQLEVVIAATLSGDPAMISDVETSDVHYEVGRGVFGWRTRSDMNKDDRRTVKGVVFGTIYGGGVETLHKQTGVPKNIVHDIQKSFKRRYRVFHRWQRTQIMNAKVQVGTDPIMKDGIAHYTRVIETQWGRKYAFREKIPSWSRGAKPSVVPSEVVNYPVQGFATGDIVPLFNAIIVSTYDPLMVTPINTVHDSVILEYDKSHEPTVSKWLQKCADICTDTVALFYGISLPTALKVEVEFGDTWT